MKAYELLSDPSKWTKDVLARSSTGAAVAPTSPSACQFCIVGALYHCYSAEEAMKIWTRLDSEFYDKHNEIGVGDWNDDPSRTHEEVVAFLKSKDL
jgi:hypothetical protein